MTSWVFTRSAAANTAGSTVTSTLGTAAKASRTLMAYSGAADPTIVTSSVTGASSNALTTPAVDIASVDNSVISYWADKTSGNTGWTLPANVTQRASSVGSGSGRITAAAGDSTVGAGNWPGATATSTVAGTKGIGWTIVLPGAVSTVPPIASFTSSCSLLECDFDGTGSTDPDGTVVQYQWNFGDGSTGSGPTVSHTYASAGTRNVTLTVTDDAGATNSFAQSVNVVVPVGAHTKLPPETPRTNYPRITTGEITDLEAIGNRVFIAGSFTSIANNQTGNTTSYNQRFLASYNLDTGLVDTSFRPTFDGGVTEIEASPDGTRLYVVGRFNTVNGVTKRRVVALNPSNGSVITAFTANANGPATTVDASATTVYIGGQFTTVNNTARVSLAAVNASNGQLVAGFVNNLSGGIGVDGLLTVQALVLTPDASKLMVVHTGRQVAGQDRYGVALISTQTNQLLPWRTRLWEDNLQFVGGIQRAYAGAISPNGQFMVVTSGSGGDRPPINDTAVALPIAGNDFVEPLWVSRMSDSIYSVAISDVAVFVGGHFQMAESPTASDPWPGLTNVGYGRGQGLGAYALGDEVVIREHLAALDPATGKAVEWYPASNSYEGNKAMLVLPRGVITGGDATAQGGYNVGRVAFFDFNSVPTPGANETTIVDPIQGRVKPAGEDFTVSGTATATSGVNRVQLEIRDRDANRYLQDDLVTWGGANTINAVLSSPGATATDWSLTLNLPDNRRMDLLARTFAQNGTNDGTKAAKKFETFGLADDTPGTSISGPAGSVIPTLDFTLTGGATDDVGVNAVNVSLRDEQGRYLQDDGSAVAVFNTLRTVPDVIGAPNATWSLDVVVPHEGRWLVEAIAIDTAGQSDIRGSTREWLVSATAVAPTVTITSPTTVIPPTAAFPITLAPGAPLTLTGTAADDVELKRVEISLRNNTTGERLANDGTWSVNNVAGFYRISPINIGAPTYNWAYTTPFDLTPGSYSFSVIAVDDLDLNTTNTLRANLTINVVIPGDNPPDTTISPTGTINGVQVLHLDLVGAATDDFGVTSVQVSLRERVSGRYIQPNGTLSSAFASHAAVLDNPGGTSTGWTLAIDLPEQGDYDVVARAYDASGQQDNSTTGATSRYPVYPGDLPPVSTDALFTPAEGAVFTDPRISTTGRFEDDQQMARVEVAIVDSLGRYMTASGTFTSTTPSFRPAFLNSPGSPGSNFSYTSPVIPNGTYTLLVRGVDQHGFVTTPPVTRTVTVATTAVNEPPVANFTYGCAENVCSFDGRTSTDETPATLTYSWAFGQGAGGSGPVPTKTYTAPGTFNVTLTVRDEWGVTATSTQAVTIVEPAGNLPPVAVISPPTCNLLVCNFSSATSSDPNVGDTITRLWNFGDGGATSTTTSPSKTFAAPGTYTITLTVTDGWGKSSVATTTVTVVAA